MAHQTLICCLSSLHRISKKPKPKVWKVFHARFDGQLGTDPVLRKYSSDIEHRASNMKDGHRYLEWLTGFVERAAHRTSVATEGLSITSKGLKESSSKSIKGDVRSGKSVKAETRDDVKIEGVMEAIAEKNLACKYTVRTAQEIFAKQPPIKIQDLADVDVLDMEVKFKDLRARSMHIHKTRGFDHPDLKRWCDKIVRKGVILPNARKYLAEKKNKQGILYEATEAKAPIASNPLGKDPNIDKQKATTLPNIEDVKEIMKNRKISLEDGWELLEEDIDDREIC